MPISKHEKYLRYKAKHKIKLRDRNHRDHYGISLAEKQVLFESQGSVCGICRGIDPGTVKGWATDHDHKTHRVRGVLCQRCNIRLGIYEQDPEFHLKAVKYLETRSQAPSQAEPQPKPWVLRRALLASQAA